MCLIVSDQRLTQIKEVAFKTIECISEVGKRVRTFAAVASGGEDPGRGDGVKAF